MVVSDAGRGGSGVKIHRYIYIYFFFIDIFIYSVSKGLGVWSPELSLGGSECPRRARTTPDVFDL